MTPRYFFRKKSFAPPDESAFEKNPDYRGEAHFQNSENRVNRVRHATNKILIDVDVRHTPVFLWVNTSYSPYWETNIGTIIKHKGVIRVGGVPAGKHLLTFDFKPRTYLKYLRRDLAVMIGLLLLIVIHKVIEAFGPKRKRLRL